MAPCEKDFERSGTSFSGSKLNISPRPSQEVHIPCGLLKLKSCGVGGWKLRPQALQA
jgi:hypothetical protein